MNPTHRKTRFVCISDTHNASPAHGAFKLPRGDVLIHAGDMTNQGSLSELRKTVDWIEKADFEAKIVIAGNHDITLDADFYAQHGLSFHNQNPQSPEDCLDLLKSSPSITYLNHESAILKLKGPGTTFKIFGSPYSPTCGLWAFGYDTTEQASHLWNQIPMDTDVVVTHTPPKNHCDVSKARGSAGCEILRQTLWRVRPRLSVCGHVHEGRGAERIAWDLHDSDVLYKECATKPWIDPGQGNAKQSLLDLTSRGGTVLDYHTTDDEDEPSLVTELHPHSGPSRRSSVSKSGGNQSPGRGSSVASRNETNAFTHSRTDPESRELASSYHFPVPGATDFLPSGVGGSVYHTRGRGCSSSSSLYDMEALSGRMRRQETCVINAAIKASSWSPKSSVGRQYNKPVVVDVDLPVWRPYMFSNTTG